MARSVLQTARKLMRRRKFGYAITLLESRTHDYGGSFEFYLALGTSCLYVGDEGSASKYYQLAREIKISNSELLLGQAAIYLRHGETDRALQYYLDILNIDPNNEVAKSALEFIRTHGDYNTICQWKDSGKIAKFYPPLGVNPDIIRNCIFAGFLLGCVVSAFIVFKSTPKKPNRSLSSTNEESEERQRAKNVEPLSDFDGGVLVYNLTEKQISDSYNEAISYWQQNRDNAALREINRILYSNASPSKKQEALNLRQSLKEPTFDTLKDEDNFTYQEVESDHFLYNNCFVSWSGRVSNAISLDNGSWECILLVGYENLRYVDGMVSVHFAEAPYPEVDPEKPIRILAKVTEAQGKLLLEGRAVYQPLKGTALN